VRAIAYDRFGGPEVLTVTELPDPPVGPDIVLVRTVAAAVNPVDIGIREGYLQSALPTHFPVVPGWDVAGVVERTGIDVSEYAPGDRVVGYVRRDEVQYGTYAEFVPAPVRTLAAAPRDLDLVTAAGIPLTGLTAWQSLHRVGVGDGDTVLVNGASGGVGTFGVQLARILGARVLGTASAASEELVRGLGVEPVRYGEGLAERVRALAPDGVDAVVDFAGGAGLHTAIELVKNRQRVASIVDPGIIQLGGRYVFVRPDPDDLAALVRLVDKGRLRVVVDTVLPLDEAAKAQEIVAGGHAHGKVILTLASE
jgi:NADPH:quinone reductase-like Zn-dependent oxidoreductase